MEEESVSMGQYIRDWLEKIREWMKPNPADNMLVQAIKFFFKCIALLVLIALSPAILVVLIFVFLAAI